METLINKMSSPLLKICLITILCNLPLATGNLYFFFLEPESTAWESSDASIDINIKQWLGISAFTQFLYIIVCFCYFLNRVCS